MGVRRYDSVVSCDRTHDLRDRQGGSRATDLTGGTDDRHDDAECGEGLDVRARVAERASYALYADAERCDNALSVAIPASELSKDRSVATQDAGQASGIEVASGDDSKIRRHVGSQDFVEVSAGNSGRAHQ